jgi:hypothetical protein
LWNRIVKDEAKVPIPNWHKKTLQERLKDIEIQPEDTHEWESVRAEIQKEHG